MKRTPAAHGPRMPAKRARRGRSAGVLEDAWQGHRGARRIARVAHALEAAYGTPDLGNLADPLDEAAYILLTVQTDIPRAQAVWGALRLRFPTWDDVASSSIPALAKVLRPAGLHRQRARTLKRLLESVRERFGAYSLDGCSTADTPTAEGWLRQLPGLDRKTARCVLLYALAREVFPVDSNVYRFAVRFGILRGGARFRRATTHDELQALVPANLRKSLHVNLVAHGQRTCTPRAPQCSACCLREACPSARRLAVGAP